MKRNLVILGTITLVIYFITSGGTTAHNHFIRLAHALLEGRYYLNNIEAAGLPELITVSPQKFYITYPPMPALIAMPLVFMFGINFPQQFIAHFLGAGIAVVSYLISYSIKKDKKLAIWIGLLASTGSIVWFLSSVGSVWYLGQITSCFFLLLAIYEGLNKKRPWVVSACIGAAYLSRIHTILSIPIFLFLLKDKFKNRNKLVEFAIPLAIFFGFNFLYNTVRFGNPIDQGYAHLDGVLAEPWFAKGLVHPSYIMDNLLTAFWTFPKLLPNPPYIQPSWIGLSIWITTPAFIFAFWSPIKQRLVQFAWLAIFLIFLLVSMHGTTGFAQFGYRFAVDFYPFLILLTAIGVSKMKGPKSIHWFLLVVGIIVNTWGVLWINKFGWVGF